MIPSTISSLRSLDLITVAGAGAEKYLQGQLSQNVSTLGVGQSAWSLLLQPQGHLVAWFRVVRTSMEEFVLIADKGAGEAITARLERFKLGTKAQITNSARLVRTEASVSDDRTRAAAAVISEDGQLVSAPWNWPGVDGTDTLLSSDGDPATNEADLLRLEALRVGVGMPRYGFDYDEKTIPAELGVVDMSADFTKGCYTGQELVARIDSRGNNTPRQLRVLDGSGSAPAIGEAAVLEGNDVGVITSSVGYDDQWVALASIKRSALEAFPNHL